MVEDDDVWQGVHAFSERDKAAIGARLTAYPDWSVAYAAGDGCETATVRPVPAEGAAPVPVADLVPVLTLARRDELTGFAAHWVDGSQFCADLSASLSGALSFIVQAIEDALGLAGANDDGLWPGGA